MPRCIISPIILPHVHLPTMYCIVYLIWMACSRNDYLGRDCPERCGGRAHTSPVNRRFTAASPPWRWPITVGVHILILKRFGNKWTWVADLWPLNFNRDSVVYLRQPDPGHRRHADPDSGHYFHWTSPAWPCDLKCQRLRPARTRLYFWSPLILSSASCTSDNSRQCSRPRWWKEWLLLEGE